MLSIGEFSNICKVSAKTLRYYAEIGLLTPNEINPGNGYRYYSIEQLKTMLFINRLKTYSFSLEEIKTILQSGEPEEALLYSSLLQKQTELKERIQKEQHTLSQLEQDISSIRQGRSIMNASDDIDVQLVEIAQLQLLSVRKLVQACDYPQEYSQCFGRLFRRLASEQLTPAAPPMVLFHSSEFTPFGLDTEFAIPVKEYVTGTRIFHPGLCLKTTVNGDYSQLPAVYARHREWMEAEGYTYSSPLYEVYVTDPVNASSEQELITEVYSPIKKKQP